MRAYVTAVMQTAWIECRPDGTYVGTVRWLRTITVAAERYEDCYWQLETAVEGAVHTALLYGQSLPVVEGIDLSQPHRA